jgi:hypothetical protein
MKAALALLAAAPIALIEPAPHTSSPGAPSASNGAVCRDRISQVREERGLPKLDRRAAAPDQPYLIAAVDKRIDGCSVMVMRNDTSDVRPLPVAPGARAELLPAR